MKLGRGSMCTALLTGLLLVGGCPEYQITESTVSGSTSGTGGMGGSGGEGGVAGGTGNVGGGGGQGGGMGGNGGGVLACVEGSACYSGPADVLNKGACKEGHAVCVEDALTECKDEVLPTIDDCKDADDTDCDGRAGCTGDPLQARSYPAQSTLVDEAIFSVATAPSGAVFLAGLKDANNLGAVSADEKPVFADLASGKPLLLRVDPAGKIEDWSDKISVTTGNALAEAVTVDGEGNVFVTGTFAGVLSLGGEAVQSPMASDRDAFIVAFDASGGKRWHKTITGTGAQRAHDVAVYGEHYVAVAGEFGGTVNFGDGMGVKANETDGFVVAFDAAGAFQWKYPISSGGIQSSVSLAASAGGDLIVGTRSKGGALIGPINLNDFEIDLVKLSAAGAQAWEKVYGGSGDQNITSVAMDPSGQVAVTGHFVTELKLEGTTYSTGGKGTDTFVALLDAQGKPVWSRQLGGTGNQIGTSVAFDPLGDVLFGCGFSTFIDFQLGDPLQTPGDIDACVAKFGGQDGKPLFARGFGDADAQIVFDIAASALAHPLVVGAFTGKIPEVKPEQQSTSKQDGFFLELAP